MNWYQGGIAEAISASKSKEAVFVVYIEGKDEKSALITQLVNAEDVATKLGGEHFVAIKIEAGSVPHQQFSQIYKQPPVPSLYFIGKQGVPLDIVTEAKDAPSLATTLNTILQKAGIQIKPTQESIDFIRNEQQQEVVSASQPPEEMCHNGVCPVKEQPSTSQEPISQTDTNAEVKEDLSPEEKVERAKQLLEEKRLQKQKEEEETDRQKEIERRKMGQNVQQLRRWQEDQELRQVLEERERERKEGQKARERVLAQIAQDKAERAAKFSTLQPQPSQASQPPSPRPVITTNTARLQFKMPDGSSSTQDFSSSDTLDTVHAYIRANLNLSFNTYTLSTTFPRREFTESDRSQTLVALELIPTAVILILPINRGGTISTNTGGGGLSGLIWTVLAPFLNILGYLKTFIFGSAPAPASGEAVPSTSSSNKRTAGPSNEQPRVQPKKRLGETTVIRRQGNVHRLSNRTDSDDENNTWNGNSTQQM